MVYNSFPPAVKDEINRQIALPEGVAWGFSGRLKKTYNLPHSIDAIGAQIRRQKQAMGLLAKGPVPGVTKDNTDHEALRNECEEKGIPFESVKHYWHKSEFFSVFAKNTQKNYGEIRDEVIAQMREYAPVYPVIERRPYTNSHLLVINPADIHIGKLASAFETGEDYDSQIAVQRVREGVTGILEKAQGFNVDQVLFVIGNDILHIDTPKRTTTSGTAMDTDGSWYSNFLIAKRLYIEIIELLLTVADVHVQYDPSNHDYTHGFFLADTISSWFSKNENVTFNVSIAHRKYFKYYQNLIGTTHGDGAKITDLPLLMAHEEPVFWGECKHRQWFLGHFHHKISKDIMSVNVEVMRSPSGTDAWHAKNGFMHAPKAIEGFVFDKNHGQICRFQHLF